MKGPGRENELSKKAKVMKYPSMFVNSDVGSSTKVTLQKVQMCSSGKDGKCYGSRAIAMKETKSMLQDLARLIESSSDDGSLPDVVIREIKSNVAKGAKDVDQAWKDALELTHKAYEVSRVRLPNPTQTGGWRQYEDVIKHAVVQLAKSRGNDGDWRVTSQLNVSEGAKDDTPTVNNLAAKHMNTFNKAATHVDRKKQAKKGAKMKHKNKIFEFLNFDQESTEAEQPADKVLDFDRGNSSSSISKDELDSMDKPQHIGSKRFFMEIPGIDDAQEIHAKNMDEIIDLLSNKARRHGASARVEERSKQSHGEKVILSFWVDGVKREKITIKQYKG